MADEISWPADDEISWIHDNHEMLTEKYPGMAIAVKRGEGVVAHAESYGELHREIEKLGYDGDVLVWTVSPEPKEIAKRLQECSRFEQKNLDDLVLVSAIDLVGKLKKEGPEAQIAWLLVRGYKRKHILRRMGVLLD